MNNNLTIDINGNKIDLSTFVDNSPDYHVKVPMLDKVFFELDHEPHFEAMANKHKILSMFKNETIDKKYYTGINPLEDGILIALRNDYIFQPTCQKTIIQCNKYVDFDSFKNNVEKCLALYNSELHIPAITRIGLRYSNRIPVCSTIPENMFNLKLNMSGKNINLAELSFTHEVENGLFAKSYFMPYALEDKIAITWDNDIFVFVATDFDTSLKLLPVFHQAATNLFLNFLSEKAQKEFLIMGGGD